MTAGRNWDWAAVALALLAFGWLLWANRMFFHDDAYISLRYARNLAFHGELAWNLGERIEGYTNFLHVLATAGLMRLGLSPELAARALNFFVVLTMFPAVMLAARRLAPEAKVARLLAILTVGATPGIAIWVLGGLEASVVATLIAWGTLGLITTLQTARLLPAFLGGLAFGLAVLTRLDSAVFIAGAGFATLLFSDAGILRRFLLATLIAALPAAIALVHMAWRLEYYGLPFPLTFYAKTGVPLAWRFGFLDDLPLYILFGVPMLFVSLAAALGTVRTRGIGAALALPLVMQLIYVIWSGGDHMAGGRVLVPLTAPAALLLLTGPSPAILAAAAAALSLAVALLAQPLNRDPAAFVGTLIGKYIAEWPPGQLISLATAGSTPFHATDNTYIDQLGLNDPVIARRDPVPYLMPVQTEPGHSKGDGAYILSREPDVIIMGAAEGRLADAPVFLSDAELAALPDFRRCYEVHTAPIEYGPEVQRLNPLIPNPLTFTWYSRICPKTGG